MQEKSNKGERQPGMFIAKGLETEFLILDERHELLKKLFSAQVLLLDSSLVGDPVQLVRALRCLVKNGDTNGTTSYQIPSKEETKFR